MTKEYGIHLETMGSHETNPFQKGERTMAEWISGDERLPRMGRKVLVADNTGYVSLAYMTDKGEWIPGFEVKLGGFYIAHWMPLPDPPEVEDD